MNVIWHILLTVCSGSTCLEQDVQWFDSEIECQTMLVEYVAIPAVGDLDIVTYVCKPKDSIAS